MNWPNNVASVPHRRQTSKPKKVAPKTLRQTTQEQITTMAADLVYLGIAADETEGTVEHLYHTALRAIGKYPLCVLFYHQGTSRQSTTTGHRSLRMLRSLVMLQTMRILSHADTTAVGANFVPIGFNGKTCTVSPFLDTHYDPVSEATIVTAATAWTHPVTAVIFIMIYHEVLWFGTALSTTLINPTSLFYNPGLLKDIHECGYVMNVRSNSEVRGTSMQGEFPGLGKV
jgi:hypothetical protein